MSNDKEWRQSPETIVPFGWSEFFNKHKIICRDYGPLLTARRALFHLSIYAAGQVGWALDRLLHSRWTETELKAPIFIVGLQRSGTTFLHRLLVKDKARARSLALHEMLLPALSIQNGLLKLAALDRKRGSKLATWLRDFQEKKYGPMDHIHRLRLDETEEDEFVLWSIFTSDMCVNDSPLSIGNKKLDGLRHFEKWPSARQKRALAWYRACLLKKIYREPAKNRSKVWYVGKNPRFTKKMPQLLKAFPDARFIYLARNPLEAIPSRISMIREIWRKRFKGFDKMTSEQIKTIYEDSLRVYLYAERDLPAIPDKQKFVVTYRELKEHPVRTVREIYKHFELPGPDPNLEKELAKLKAYQKPYVSKHSYNLDEFGLDERKIRALLTHVFEKYDF